MNFNINFLREHKKGKENDSDQWSSTLVDKIQLPSALVSAEVYSEEIPTNYSNQDSHEELSRYFYKDRILTNKYNCYATLLGKGYAGLLIPNPTVGKLSTSHINKRYFSALDLLLKICLCLVLTELRTDALPLDGYLFWSESRRDKKSVSFL